MVVHAVEPEPESEPQYEPEPAPASATTGPIHGKGLCAIVQFDYEVRPVHLMANRVLVLILLHCLIRHKRTMR